MLENQIENEIISEDKSLTTLIEEKRAPLYKEFGKSRKISNILTIVILIIACGGMYLLSAGETWMTILGWGILLLGVAAMVLFYVFSKKRFEQHTKEYVAFVANAISDSTFKNKNFKNLETTSNKIEVNDLAGNGAYSDIIRVASRNVTNGEYSGLRFSFADIAFFRKGQKKNTSLTSFVGKYINVFNSLKMNGNIVIEIQGKEPMDLPNGVDDKNVLVNDEKITIYGPEGTDPKEVLGQQFYSSLKKLPVEEHFLNLVISVWEGRTFVFMSYDDAVVAMPFDKAFNSQAFDAFTNDLEAVFKSVSLLGK